MAAETARAAILLLAHGTPNAVGEMEGYLRLVTGGRPLAPEIIAELQHRYAEIGLPEKPGPNPPPLTHWTFAQRALLEEYLARRYEAVPVYAAMRNWHPLIAEVVEQIRRDRITHLTALCLAPQNSRTSVGLYRKALVNALAATAPSKEASDPLTLNFIEAWADEDALIEAFAGKLREAYTTAATELGADLPVLFTAHSVPCRTVLTSSNGTASAAFSSPAQEVLGPDPYPVEAKRTAALVFERAFGTQETSAQGTRLFPSHWFFAFQSQGVAGGPWIGPTVEDTLAAMAQEGYRGVVLQPIGFLCDHVEILYDIDIAFQRTARDLGIRLFRAESLNDCQLLTEAIANVLLRQRAPHSVL